ncbi:uncharacterized protein LOC128392023 [Panonychus citri]|uniref:uncharacterized protein LOC128392023 n=1 Tax=Panonychus citri TaxID=50023 RepID=UPI002307E016|nr:uncharacterized protein LOC128392023 [Panonychus citri]
MIINTLSTMDHQISRNVKLPLPSGLIAILIRSNRRVYKLIIFLISILLIVSGLARLYFSNRKVTLSIDRLDRIWNRIYDISIGFCILVLIFNRNCYNQFIIELDELIPSQFKPLVGQYIVRRRKYLQLCTLISVLYELFYMFSVEPFVSLLSKKIVSNPMIFQLIGLTILRLIYSVAWINYHIFLAEICVHLQSIFIGIFANIESIDKQNRNLFDQIRFARLIYFEAGEMVKRLDSYLILSILSFYVYTIGTCHLNFLGLFDNETPPILNCIYFIGETVYLVTITYQLVYVNWLSVKSYTKVYSLSFGSPSLEVVNEVNLFLTRISGHDIGFTFCKLFVITSKFVSSLATISLTIALAVPSFLNHNCINN